MIQYIFIRSLIARRLAALLCQKIKDYGKFYGNPVLVVPQRHKIGTTDFVFDDNTINIIAGDDKPIKVVYEGQPLIVPKTSGLDNEDFTPEYFYGESYGVGLVLAAGNTGIGKYQFTA